MLLRLSVPFLAAVGCAGPIEGTLTTETLQSSATGRTYTLTIFEPDALAASPSVVYLMDGDDWSEDTARIVSTLAREDGLPAPLVVGIGYGDGPNERARDYTPPGPGTPRGEGQVDVFLDFVVDDLVPHVQDGWPVRTDAGGRVLAGHSFGGVAAVWGQLTRSGDFRGCIGVSPSLVRGDTAAFRAEADYADEHDDLDARIYLAAGSQEAYGLAGLTLAMGDALEARAYPSLHLRTELLAGRYHAATLPEGMTAGLLHVLGDAR